MSSAGIIPMSGGISGPTLPSERDKNNARFPYASNACVGPLTGSSLFPQRYGLHQQIVEGFPQIHPVGNWREGNTPHAGCQHELQHAVAHLLVSNYVFFNEFR